MDLVHDRLGGLAGGINRVESGWKIIAADPENPEAGRKKKYKGDKSAREAAWMQIQLQAI